MSSTAKRIRKTDLWVAAVALLCAMLGFVSAAQAQQLYLQGVPEEDQFGNVMLNKYVTPNNGPVVFEHWLHRSKFTCRVCHVDIGFGMQANATGIDAKTNAQGFYCGACHDGKRQFAGVTVFRACVPDGVANTDGTCARCHISKKTKYKYSYGQFTAKLPKARYGVDWMAAEKSELVKPIDIVEGVSVPKERIKNRADLAIRPNVEWFTGIHFSHGLHSKWNGCELCHPEIFPTQKSGSGPGNITMYQIAKGRYCGACHVKVAFPINGCNQCHAKGPNWVDGPGWVM